MPVMGTAELFGYQAIERFTDQFLGRVFEQIFNCRVGEYDPARGINDNDGVGQQVEEVTQYQNRIPHRNFLIGAALAVCARSRPHPGFDNRMRLPASLDELGIELPLDPWGQAYVYLNIEDAGPGFGGMRKDGKPNPLNSDYDLYSIGKDGETQGPLNAQSSHDAIVRANNGAYIGRGEDY